MREACWYASWAVARLPLLEARRRARASRRARTSRTGVARSTPARHRLIAAADVLEIVSEGEEHLVAALVLRERLEEACIGLHRPPPDRVAGPVVGADRVTRGLDSASSERLAFLRVGLAELEEHIRLAAESSGKRRTSVSSWATNSSRLASVSCSRCASERLSRKTAGPVRSPAGARSVAARAGAPQPTATHSPTVAARHATAVTLSSVPPWPVRPPGLADPRGTS